MGVYPVIEIEIKDREVYSRYIEGEADRDRQEQRSMGKDGVVR